MVKNKTKLDSKIEKSKAVNYFCFKNSFSRNKYTTISCICLPLNLSVFSINAPRSEINCQT